VARTGPQRTRPRKNKAAKDKAAKDKAAKDAAEKDMVSKGAMDAAMDARDKLLTEKFVKTQHEIQDALRNTRPFVGEMNIAFDSEPGVYEAAFKAKKVDLTPGGTDRKGSVRDARRNGRTH
jgi:hypothetical protein